MPNLNLNSTDYVHSYEPNTNDLTMAMDYNASGEPVLRVNNVGGVTYNNAGNISASSDAFGRLRISQPFTLFDSSLRYLDNGSKWDTAISGTGSTNYLVNESSLEMSVSADGDQVIRETKNVFAYQPGKGLLVLSTVVMNQAQTGLRQRVGYFGAQNGVYFEQDGEELYLVIRKYTSGSVDDVSERIPQSEWNVDRLNGEGGQYNISLATLDITKAQIWWCDIEWLGVGSVRTGFVINGQFVVCHIFHHANILDSVYMTTATLPCRYEITSTGASGTMKQICTSVMSEAGYENRSISHTAFTGLDGKNLSQTAFRPLISIRLKSTRLDSVVVPTKYDLLGLQQAAYKYAIIINPTLTGADWTSVDTDSAVEYDISATALSGGHIIDSGIFVGSTKGGSASISNAIVDFSQQLGRFLDGTSDIFCLAAIATTNNDDAAGSLTWQEHR
jgi:hypothetical protein